MIVGGNSPWGSIIDAAAARYGWTYDYIVWGVSYINLQMMLYDQITEIYTGDGSGETGGTKEKGFAYPAETTKLSEVINLFK